MKIAPEVQSKLITVGLVVVGGLIAYHYAKKFGEEIKTAAGAVGTAVNPLDDKNLASKAAMAVAGEKQVATFFEKVFAGIDLINPFNKDDTLAKEIYKENFKQQTAPIVKAAETVKEKAFDFFEWINPVNAVQRIIGEEKIFEDDDALYREWEKFNK